MPDFTVQSRDFDNLARDAKKWKQNARSQAWASVRATTLDTVGVVKVDMPVLWGRARSSWGVYTPKDIVEAGHGSKASDAVLEFDERQLKSRQGSNVPYIQSLNEGSSKKAPAGFIDRAERWAERDLVRRLKKLKIDERFTVVRKSV